jgi:3-hydroxyisobutyrate dehydrogenase-like beta-hydroxyacid dehydrogenase
MSERFSGTIAVLGLGEAGATLATGLAARLVRVRGWDPDPARTAEGVERVASALQCAAQADVVLSVNAQAAAIAAAESVLAALAPGRLYADLNTTSPSLKRRVAEIVVSSGAAFVDVAILGPVPATGVRTPCLVSGPGAERFAEVFRPLGMPVEIAGPDAGTASTRKLLRSIFMKGLAASVVESLAAADAAGCEDWLRGELATVLEGSLVERLVEGSKLHARRRVDELKAAAELERELGLEPYVADAAAATLRGLL